jgi:uncharacterized protein YdcH (DUF465 family)
MFEEFETLMNALKRKNSVFYDILDTFQPLFNFLYGVS